MEHAEGGGAHVGAAQTVAVAGVPAAQLPWPSHAPLLQGVPATAGAQAPFAPLHWVDTHSAPPHFGVPVHAPAWHVSEPPKTHALPSAQATPLAAAGFEHWPVDALHVPATWHESEAVHVTGFDPVHVPLWQVSVCVHAFESLQAAPFAAAGFEHWPLEGSHVPATWHWSEAAQVTGFEPVHTPLWQESVCVQASLSVHALPLVTFEYADVLTLGWHDWHALLGFVAAEPTHAPPMSQ